MTVSTNVPRERWNQPHEREHLAAAYQCGEALT